MTEKPSTTATLCREVQLALAHGEPLDDGALAHIGSCLPCSRASHLVQTPPAPLPALLPTPPTLPQIQARIRADHRRNASVSAVLGLAASALLAFVTWPTTLEAPPTDPAILAEGTAELMAGLDLLSGETDGASDEDAFIDDLAFLDPYPGEELPDPASTLFGEGKL